MTIRFPEPPFSCHTHKGFGLQQPRNDGAMLRGWSRVDSFAGRLQRNIELRLLTLRVFGNPLGISLGRCVSSKPYITVNRSPILGPSGVPPINQPGFITPGLKMVVACGNYPCWGILACCLEFINKIQGTGPGDQLSLSSLAKDGVRSMPPVECRPRCRMNFHRTAL